MQERDFLMAGFSGVAFLSPKKIKETQVSSGELFSFIPYLTNHISRASTSIHTSTKKYKQKHKN